MNQPRHQAADTGTRRRPSWRQLVIGSGVVIALIAGVVALLVNGPRPFAAGDRSSALVVGSLPVWNLTKGTGVIAAHPGSFTEVSPWIYGIAPSGQIVAQDPERAAGTTAAMDRLRTLGVPLIPSVANVTDGDWAYPPVAAILHDPAAMSRHISNIITLVNREGYAGIDIDYEDLQATDRQAFTTFVTRLGDALHAQRKVLSVALFAKTTDAGEDQRNVAQDFAALGEAADQVRLMAYDYHWESSPPGPVAPITWVRQVLAYAKTQIRPDKIVLGIPVAGYDWVDGHGEVVTWQQCFDRAKAFHATVAYDGSIESPWFRYTDAQGRHHEVWFENADSTAAKLDVAKESGIRGVYLWMYGGEDDRTWATLHRVLASPG